MKKLFCPATTEKTQRNHVYEYHGLQKTELHSRPKHLTGHDVFHGHLFHQYALSCLSSALCFVVCPAGTNPGTDGMNEVLTPWGGAEPFYLLLLVVTGQNQFGLVFPSFVPYELVETRRRLQNMALQVGSTQHTPDAYKSLLQSVIAYLRFNPAFRCTSSIIRWTVKGLKKWPTLLNIVHVTVKCLDFMMTISYSVFTGKFFSVLQIHWF